MKRHLHKILTVILLFAGFLAQAQYKSEGIDIFFEQGKHDVRPNFEGNEERMRMFADSVQRLVDNDSYRVHYIRIESNTSPEGDFEFNQGLSYRRNVAAREYLLLKTIISDTIVEIDSRVIDWNYLAGIIRQDPNYVGSKDAVLDILASHPADSLTERDIVHERIRQLKAVNGGSSWAYMHDNLFPEMRNARITIVFERADEPIESPAVKPLALAPVLSTRAFEPLKVELPKIEPMGSLYLKTNVPALAMLILNAAVEYCFVGDAFSINLPIYYSAVDYFRDDLNFRTFSLYPEFRYWIPGTGANGTRGLFVGAHFGMAYYNYAFMGELRYQDHNGENPALGGGLAVGYRLPLTPDRKWNIEFSVGAGVYSLYYDTFYNVPNGKLTGIHKDTYWGLDNASISISYRFDLVKKP